MNIPFGSLGMLKDIDVAVSVELGGTNMRLRDVVSLGEGQVVMLDRLVDEPLDLLVNGKIVARGEVISEGNRFGLRILEMTSEDDEIEVKAPAATPLAGGAV